MEIKTAAVLYSKLAPTENGNLTDSEILLMKKASRWVIFLAVFQLVLAIFSGSLLHWILAAIFVPMGIVGAARRRPKLLVAHFVYSVFQYVLSLMGIVFLIVYCDECSWPIYLIAFFIIIIQAVGMRHSRILITLVKLQETPVLPMVAVQQQEYTPQPPVVEQQQQQQQQPQEGEQQQQQQPFFYVIPMPYGQQPNAQQPAGMMPAYYPMPMAYPLLHPQQQQELSGEAPTFPSVYKQ